MSESIVKQVASGVAPQPGAASAEPTNTEAIEQLASENLSGEPTTEQSQESAIDAAEASGQITKQEAKDLKKRLKLKVDGQEFEEEVDFNDDEALKRHLQKSKAFDKRMQEFSGYKSNVDRIFKMIEEDPEAFLESIGKDVDELAEKRLTRKLEEMKKSPEQLEKERLTRELEALRKEAEETKKEKENAQLEQLKQQHAIEIERDIKTALSNANTVLPKNSPLVMHRIGQAMFMAMQNGYPEVTAAEVIPYVEKQFRQELSELFKVIPEDTIEALIGKEPLEKLRKARVAKARSATPVPSTKVVDTGKSSKGQEPADAPKKRFKDFFNFSS